jgi:glycosyltransferase involved in cell wall biosynthesis
MPGVEDFGIVPVEAMACGTPVIALGAGGVLDSVLPDVTGQLVPASDSDDRVIEDFAVALSAFDDAAYDRVRIRRHAEGFSCATFRRRMQEVVYGALG